MYDKNSQAIFQESTNNINQNQSEENSGGNSSQNGTEDQPQTAEHGVVNSGPIRIITIIGQIEGHTQLPKDAKTTKYEHLIPMLAEMQRDNNDKRHPFYCKHIRRRRRSGPCIGGDHKEHG